jgi:PIN domain nuclease of toxin-antitoxin system
MSSYIADTHALIWYLGGSSRLGDEARAIFDSATEGESRIFIPAIVVAELIMFAEKHKTIEPEKILARLRAMPGFEFLALLPETAASIRDLTALPDIHDRLIVAEAMTQNMPLISFDAAITRSKLVKVVW